jgi:hypothetical protein
MSETCPDIEALIAARRQAASESLKPISHDELIALGEKLFPEIDHPWLEIYDAAVKDPHTIFFTGQAGDDIAFIYAPEKNRGLWYRSQGTRGVGPIQERGLKILAEIVAAK